MLKAIQPAAPTSLEQAFCPALKNLAVARCADVWERVHQAVLAKTKSEYRAETAASKAFRNAMPPLSGYQDICDFIACVGYGMLSEIIDGRSAARLLFAAQVALNTISQQSKTQVRGVA